MDVIPVQLNEDAKVPEDDATLDVAGWEEYDGNNWVLSQLKSVEVEYMSNEACTRKPHRYSDHWVKDTMMCVSHKPGEGTRTRLNITPDLVHIFFVTFNDLL